MAFPPPISLTFPGVGSAFTTADYYQSNALLTGVSGRRLLIDCGGDARFALAELGVGNADVGRLIDGAFISHLHADHVGGLEWFAFCSMFAPSPRRPQLLAAGNLLDDLWNHTLSGGLRSLQDRQASLEDYFEPLRLEARQPFHWDGLELTPIPSVHVYDGPSPVDCFGLLIRVQGTDGWTYFTGDTQFRPDLAEADYERAWRIFHDCETSACRSGVHAHYSELVQLPDAWKQKMWLYHYQPQPPPDPRRDGFRGFVRKGQTFSLQPTAPQDDHLRRTSETAQHSATTSRLR